MNKLYFPLVTLLTFSAMSCIYSMAPESGEENWDTEFGIETATQQPKPNQTPNSALDSCEEEDWDLVSNLAGSQEMKALLAVARNQIHQDVEIESTKIKRDIAALILQTLEQQQKSVVPHHDLLEIRAEGQQAYAKVVQLAHTLQQLKHTDDHKHDDRSVNRGSLAGFGNISNDTIEGVNADEEDFSKVINPELQRKLSIKK